MIALTASAALATSLNARRIKPRASGTGVNLSVAATISPSVPSAPISSRVKSYPTAPLLVSVPVRIKWPWPSTKLRPKTLSRVAPYFTALGPPALHAKLPPMLQNAALVGSGGQKKPYGAGAVCSAPLSPPGCTRARRFCGSISIICVMRSKLSTTQPRMGTAAPVVAVPRPRAVSGIRLRAQIRTTACTCSMLCANTTASAARWCLELS